MVCSCHIEIDAHESVEAVPLFGLLKPSVASTLLDQGHVRHFEKNDLLIERGDPTQEIYVMLSGRAHVLSFGESGRFVSFACLGPGDVIGELAAIDGEPRSASVVANKPGAKTSSART